MRDDATPNAHARRDTALVRANTLRSTPIPPIPRRWPISADRLTNDKIVEMVPVDRFANREARLPAAGGSIVFL